jgi:transposase-like protein
MKARNFKALLKQVSGMSRSQREALSSALTEASLHEDVAGFIDSQDVTVQCPDCDSTAVQKYGVISGLQRYRCKACRRTFNRLSGTPFSRLRRKEKWLGVMEGLAQKESLNAMSQRLKVKKDTAIRWRHRFPAAFRNRPPVKLGGIVEADETFFRRSEKGNRRLERKSRKRGGEDKKPGLSQENFDTAWIARDRARQTDQQVTWHRDAHFVKEFLKPRIQKGSVLCTDSRHGYKKFSKAEGIQHIALNASQKERVKDGVYHIRNVNAYHSRLKGWIAGFNGVTSRYPANYLEWFRLSSRVSEGLLQYSPQGFLKLALFNA